MDSSVVDQDVVHLEVRPLRVFPLLELDERILQAIPTLGITNDLAAHNLPKPRKDEFQILALGHLIQLAHEENVLRGRNVREGQVSHNLESEGLGSGVPRSTLGFESIGVGRFVDGFFVPDSEGRELGGGRDGRGRRNVQSDGIREGVV